jgi:formimidoylglutamate deiminase
MVNAHSHAFQIGLRGRGERDPRDFWSWRDVMYGLVSGHDEDSMRAACAEAFAQMRAAGYGAVGEFHYIPSLVNAVLAGAADAGMPVALIPAAYHRGGHERFRHETLDEFLATAEPHAAVAAHSVRAVPAEWLREIAAYADARAIPRHVHASEQPRELQECHAEHGCSPIELLARTGFLSPTTTVVHATHVSDADVALLAETRTIVCVCPTTEGNLGDGRAPALRLAEAGVRLAIGSDSNVRIDPFEEVRELETGARRDSLSRVALLERFDGDLWGELARNGAASIGLTGDPPAPIEIDRSHPDLHGVADDDVPWALATCASAGVVAPGRPS